MESSKRDKFLQAARDGANFIPLSKSWPADLETPLSTWLKVGNNNLPGVLLESVEGGETLGRWSVVASDPLWVATAKGNKLLRKWRNGLCEECSGDPFNTLRNWLSTYKTTQISDVPPIGHLYGMWGYELINCIENKVPIYKSSKEDLPDGIWMFMDRLLIFDQVKRLFTAVAYGDLTETPDPQDAYKKSSLRIKQLQDLMALPLKNVSALQWNMNVGNLPKTSNNWTQNEFETAVKDAKEYIKKGDIFQIVISQKFSANVSHQPIDLYRSLRMVNPSPFMAFFDFGDWQLIGSSPEVMVKAAPSTKRNGIDVSLRPIAGTRPRGMSEKQDVLFAEELLSDPKERAEHVMLVDLGRNDLGRVCDHGSVEVNELMIIERYSHVMHIVSEVRGHLRDDKDIWDLLKASFPAGTVSGAPKIRAMQLINKFEKERRGPYSGIYGSMDLNGALNTAITIRTMVVQPNLKGGWNIEVQAGAGVVADSIPSMEYKETINKAKGLLTAVACLELPS